LVADEVAHWFSNPPFTVLGVFIICNLAVDLAEFHKCLLEYTAHNLVTLLGLAYSVVLSNSVAR